MEDGLSVSPIPEESDAERPQQPSFTLLTTPLTYFTLFCCSLLSYSLGEYGLSPLYANRFLGVDPAFFSRSGFFYADISPSFVFHPLNALLFPYTCEGIVDGVFFLVSIWMGWYWIVTLLHFSSWRWMLTIGFLHLSLLSGFLLFPVSTPVAGLRLVSIAIQTMVAVSWTIDCIARIRRWKEPTLVAYISACFLLTLVHIPFSKAHSMRYDGLAVLLGLIYSLSNYSWRQIPSSPTVISNPVLGSLPFLTLPFLLGIVFLLCLLISACIGMVVLCSVCWNHSLCFCQ